MKGQRPNRLSSLDLVPEEGRDDIVWALAELNTRTRTQADILFELNDRLAVKGIDPISKSAFNRRAVRIAVHGQRTAERNALFATISPSLSPEKIDETTIVLGELIKNMITDQLDEPSDKMSTKNAMELSRAYLAAVQGQKISTDRLVLSSKYKKMAEKAIETVSALRGLTPEAKDAMRKELFGLRDER